MKKALLIKCIYCNHHVSKNRLKAHLKQHSTSVESVFCDLCLKQFDGAMELSEHLRENHPNSVKYWCDTCDAAFMDKRLCKQHALKHLEEKEMNGDFSGDDDDGLPFREEGKTKREGKHVCHICNIKFLSLDLLNQHQNIHTGERPFKCDMCDKSYPLKLSLGKHKVIKHNPNYKPKKPLKRLQCEECGKQFAYTHSLKTHMLTHTGQKFFVCSLCGKSLSSRQTLYEHVNAIHTGNKPFACDECDKSFVTQKILRLHKKIHLKDKPFECKMCGKGFTQSTALLFHMRYHLGQKPFTCSHCNKGFVSVSLMKRHIRLSHDECNKEILHCSQCPETFISKLMLKKHKKVHWPSVYSCEPCQKSFDLRSKYNRHVRSHNKSDLKCGHCGKILSSKSSLKRHAKTHAGEGHKALGHVMIFPQYRMEVKAENDTGMYKCIICGKSFSRELLLYVHITSHSQDIHNLENGKDFGYVTQDGQNGMKCHACISCGYTTGVLKTMISHIRTHLSSENVYPYNKENRIPEESAEEGETEETGNVGDGDLHQCEICRKKCKDRYDLAWHVKNKHESHGIKYKCNACNKVYPGVEGTCDLCGRALTKLSPLGQIMQGVQVKDEESSGEQSFHEDVFECDTCKECFSCKKELLGHLKTHLTDTRRKRQRKGGESTAGRRCGKTGKKKMMMIKQEKPFKCDVENCRYATSQYSRLTAHKFKHNPFFKCVTCQEKFSSRAELKNHMSTHGERPFKCDQCSKCYKDKHGLGWHKKVQHDPSRLKFTCELCGKTYPFDSLLTQHINLTHAAEKQSVCDICGKNVSKTYLPMHRRTHGEKQYSCDICEKTFLEKAYLKRHKMVHTGEKPYVCSVCGNSFRQHSTLTIHMRTHTGDRPYKCVLCENAYKTHHNLKKHYKRSGHKIV